jgi:hypothetical protein
MKTEELNRMDQFIRGQKIIINVCLESGKMIKENIEMPVIPKHNDFVVLDKSKYRIVKRVFYIDKNVIDILVKKYTVMI